MTDPASLAKTIESASKVANTHLFTTIIDKVTGFKLSEWAAEGEVRKKLIHDEYEKAKEGGIIGMQYIEYMRNTENLIETAVKSSKYIEHNRPNEIKMDNDFFWNTIEHAKTVSNDFVQELIAKIIAGEYNKPGTYSMSTLQILKMLGKKELELFEKVCSFCLNKNIIPRIVFALPKSAKNINKNGVLTFAKFQHLQSLGLFLPNPMSKNIKNIEMKNISFSYFDEIITFKPLKSNLTLKFPEFYHLSESGKEIINVLKPEFVEEYVDWLKENFKIDNYKLIEN